MERSVKDRVRKCYKPIKQHFFHKDGGMFLTPQEAREDPSIKNLPGLQNDRRGTATKKARKHTEKSRRVNRK